MIYNKKIQNHSFLVLGGAGSIGQEVVKILFKNNPLKLHVVDASENNLVELVRDIRSSFGYIKGEFKVFALDISSIEYDKFFENDGKYDYVMNMSALKHVRSEKDPYTLMRLINTNIFNVEKTLNQSIKKGIKNYFSVSTDKAANPVNLMGASKRIMELIMFQKSDKIKVSSARFANVLYSDGSLLYSFTQRLLKNQPIVAPSDIKRYFISKQEAARLCLMSTIYGLNRDIFFPKLDLNKDLISLKELAISFLNENGFTPIECESENEARNYLFKITNSTKWPCYFSKSNTSGEKPFEEFYSKSETIANDLYEDIGVIKNENNLNLKNLNKFRESIEIYKNNKIWKREDIIKIFKENLNELNHIEKNKFLDDRM